MSAEAVEAEEEVGDVSADRIGFSSLDWCEFRRWERWGDREERWEDARWEGREARWGGRSASRRSAWWLMSPGSSWKG